MQSILIIFRLEGKNCNPNPFNDSNNTSDDSLNFKLKSYKLNRLDWSDRPCIVAQTEHHEWARQLCWFATIIIVCCLLHRTSSAWCMHFHAYVFKRTYRSPIQIDVSSERHNFRLWIIKIGFLFWLKLSMRRQRRPNKPLTHCNIVCIIGCHVFLFPLAY